MFKILGVILFALVYCQAGFSQQFLGRQKEAPHEVEMGATNDPIIQGVVAKAFPDDLKHIQVLVRQGVAYLSGTVNSNTDYEQVITIAESTPGVTDVNADNLKIKDSKTPIHDVYITAKVKGALLKSTLLGKDIPGWSVHVETKNGVVYLSGMIRTSFERSNVLDVVKSVHGIAGIKDELVVIGER